MYIHLMFLFTCLLHLHSILLFSYLNIILSFISSFYYSYSSIFPLHHPLCSLLYIIPCSIFSYSPPPSLIPPPSPFPYHPPTYFPLLLPPPPPPPSPPPPPGLAGSSLPGSLSGHTTPHHLSR